MQFTPKSKEELDKANLFEKGTYDIECIKAEEKTSVGGNPMMVLTHRVFVGDVERYHTDFLVLNNDLGLGKLYSFCDAVGLKADYDRGELHAEDCEGKCCRASFVQKEKVDRATKQKTGEWRNELRGYFAVQTPEGKASIPTAAQPDDEDKVPF